MRNAIAAWRQNLREKVGALNKSLLSYLASHDDGAVDQILLQFTGLQQLFGPTQIPAPVRNLPVLLQQFRAGKHPDAMKQILELYRDLPAVAEFADDEPLSFDKILEQCKQDGELAALADELIALLEKILAEADDSLSSHIARELSVVLEQLKKRNQQPVYEWMCWLDLGARALLLAADTYSGFPGCTLLYEGATLAVKVREKLQSSYDKAQRQMLTDGKLTYLEKALKQVPEIPSEADLQKRLPAPTDSPPGSVEGDPKTGKPVS